MNPSNPACPLCVGDIVTTDFDKQDIGKEFSVLRCWRGQCEGGWLITTEKHQQLSCNWFKPTGKRASWAPKVSTNPAIDWDDDIPF